MAKSTNGVIVAVSDCRNNSSADLPNSIDIAEVWSGDNGFHWSAPRVGIDVANDGDVRKLRDIGDPCMLYDPVGNKFWLMAITGGGLASSHDSSGNSIADVVLYTRGTGEDDTWEEWTGGPEGNRRSVKQMILNSLADVEGNETYRDENQIRGILQGPGHGIVLRKDVTNELGEVIMPAGTIVFPMQYFPLVDGWSDKARSFAAYSKDGGITWNATKLTPSGEYAQENCVMELDDGSWYMICKGKTSSQKQRQLFRTTDFVEWSHCGSITPSQWVQGSCMRIGEGRDGKSRYVACFATGGSRSDLTLHFGRDTSLDNGATKGVEWDCGKVNIYPYATGNMSYNSLVMLDATTLGVMFESFGHIYMKRVDVSVILAGEMPENAIDMPSPVAVWDGDFRPDSLTKFTGYTLTDWNLTHGGATHEYQSPDADYSNVTIDRNSQGLMFDAANPLDGITVVVRYSGLAVDSSLTNVLFTSSVNSNHQYDRTGVQQCPDGKLIGLANNSTSANGSYTYGNASGTLAQSGVMAFTYSTSGTYLYYGTENAKISSSAVWGSSSLKYAADTAIYGAGIGGMYAGASKSGAQASKGMTIEAIAVFDNVVTSAGLKSYIWPSRETPNTEIADDGVTVTMFNTNSIFEDCNCSVSSSTLTIPAGQGDVLWEERIILKSLDLAYTADHKFGYTHAKRIAITVGDKTFMSALVVTNSTDNVMTDINGTSTPRLVYSFVGADCVIPVNERCPVKFLDANGNEMTTVRYKVAGDVGTIIDGVAYSTYKPVFQLNGELVRVDSMFDWTPGSAPTGQWFTSWSGENFGAAKTVVGPDGKAQSIHVTFHDGDANNQKWIPYCSDDARGLTNFTFCTYGCADMVKASSGKYAVLWCMGKKQNAKTALVKDPDGNVCLVQVTGEQSMPSRTIIAGSVKGYHLFTVRFSQTGGASLQIDDGQIYEDPDFNTVAYAGFQVVSVRSGCGSPFEMGLGFAVLKMLAFESSKIPTAQYAALCAQYPVIDTFGGLVYDVNGGALHLPSLTMTNGALRIMSGTLEVPTGVEASLSALEFGDAQGNPSFGMNLAGKITINTASTGADNGYNSAYSDCNSGRGVNLGEWTGNGTHRITGAFIASNTIVEVCHDSTNATTTIDGGEFSVKGITAKNADRASFVLTGGGMLNLGRYPSCTVAIRKTYGLGTVTGTADWTDTDAITLNGEGIGTTFLADGINLVFAGAVTGSGNATINAPNGGSVEFANYNGTGNIVVNAGSLKVPSDASISGSITVMDGAALDIITDDPSMATASFGAGSLDIQEGGAIKVNGEPVPEGYTLDVSGGSISITPNITEDAITHDCVLRISEIMPKPTDALNRGQLEGMDVNGLESGWVEVENTSDKWADLADYKFIRSNRGKKTGQADFGNFPSRYVPPHGRAIFYTSERYSNSADMSVSAWATPDVGGVKPKIYADLGNILVWPDKVNPKKSPFVRLIHTASDTIADTVVVPSDIPEGCSIIVGKTLEGEATKRWLCQTPTRGKENTDTADLVRLGPNVGPLYELTSQKKHDSANEFVRPVPPAKPGEDYEITFSLNPVMHPTVAGGFRDEDAITNIVLVYRTDLTNAEQRVSVSKLTETYDSKDWGYTYTVAIPAADLPAPGHLVQWKFEISDASGGEWISPSFNNPDDGYEWYGTIVEAPGLESATLPTWHMFATGDHLTQKDYDKDDKENYTLQNGARIAIYDSSTSNYYDYVRIDLRGNTSARFTKKGHGLRFAKSHPLTMTDIVTGATIEEIRKTSLISEFADPSYMRQMMAFWLWRKMGNLVPFDFPVRCNLNGEFYQLAFNSERFTDELIEDVYGLDKFGYGYKNVGTLNQSSTTAGSIEKKTPDDEDESNISVLTSSLISPLRQNGANNEHSTSESESLTKFVVQKFDLPAWLNYLASARITQEMDDVWANVCAYYDNPTMFDGARGIGTWMPLGYDFNLAFGQYYINDLESGALNGLSATNDWYKSHPLYGGWTICAHRSASGSSMNGNNGFEAVYQSAKFRRLYLRRLRTLMDQELKEPGTATNDTPFMAKMYELADIMRADAALDQNKWPNNYTDGNIDVWTTRPENMDAGIQDIWDNYVVPRREHLYVTHSVTNTAKAIGYGSNLNAGIPEAQSPIATLAPNISLDVSGQAEGYVVVSNGNTEAVDMSGWRLSQAVVFTMPPGTVCDAHDVIYIVADRRAYVESHEKELTDQVIVGNATFNLSTTTMRLFDADGAEVAKFALPSNESNYLRIHSWDGVPPLGDDGVGEWIALTNISTELTLDLTGVSVMIGKDTVSPKCNITLESGALGPGGTITLRYADFGQAKGWEKITNGDVYLQVADANGTIGQTTSDKIVQSSFGGYKNGWFYLQVTSVGETFGMNDVIAVHYPPVPGVDMPLEAMNEKEAEAALADCEIALTVEDEARGLVTNVLKLVAVPVVHVDPSTSVETISYVARVEIDETKVDPPAIAEPETQDDKPVKVEDVVGGKEVSVSITNAVKGLWYGCEVADELGATAAFGNDVGSFYRASNTTHTVIASPRTQPSGFFRVKVLPVRPTE